MESKRERAFSLLSTEVSMRARHGVPLAEIHGDLIAPSDFSEDQKAVLWLQARGYMEAGRRRYETGQDRIRRQARRLRPLLGNE